MLKVLSIGLEETNEEYYELTFGDGYFGKALKDGAKIFVTYLVSNGELANGINCLANFAYGGDHYSLQQGDKDHCCSCFNSCSNSDNSWWSKHRKCQLC